MHDFTLLQINGLAPGVVLIRLSGSLDGLFAEDTAETIKAEGNTSSHATLDVFVDASRASTWCSNGSRTLADLVRDIGPIPIHFHVLGTYELAANFSIGEPSIAPADVSYLHNQQEFENTVRLAIPETDRAPTENLLDDVKRMFPKLFGP